MPTAQYLNVPTKVRITNKLGDPVHILHLAYVEAGIGKTRVIDMTKYNPELALKLWNALRLTSMGKCITVEVVDEATPVTVAPKPVPTPPEPLDDFSVFKGVDSVLNKRLHAHGIKLYKDFAAADEKDLLRIEGLTPTTLPSIAQQVAVKLGLVDTPVTEE